MSKPLGAMLVAVTLTALGLIPVTAQAPAGANIPRKDGHPDLLGIWQAFGTAEYDLRAHHAHKGWPAGISAVEGNEIPYLPAALAKKQANEKAGEADDPNARCYMPGVPRIMYMSYPFEIIPMTAKRTTMLFEWAHVERNIFTDGTPHPKDGLNFWMGDSRGRWDGDTFVIDSNNFNNKTWFDKAGDYHSDQLDVVERLTMLDADHIDYKAMITDPKVYSRPWTIDVMLYRRREPNMQVLEYECFAFDLPFVAPIPGAAQR